MLLYLCYIFYYYYYTETLLSGIILTPEGFIVIKSIYLSIYLSIYPSDYLQLLQNSQELQIHNSVQTMFCVHISLFPLYAAFLSPFPRM